MHNGTKHTPGPWKLEVVPTQVGICHRIGPLGSTTKLHNACLYDDCYSATPKDMQLAADAKLIAAAPDMAEALLEAVHECRCSLRERESGHLIGCYAPKAIEALTKAGLL